MISILMFAERARGPRDFPDRQVYSQKEAEGSRRDLAWCRQGSNEADGRSLHVLTPCGNGLAVLLE